MRGSRGISPVVERRRSRAITGRRLSSQNYWRGSFVISASHEGAFSLLEGRCLRAWPLRIGVIYFTRGSFRILQWSNAMYFGNNKVSYWRYRRRRRGNGLGAQVIVFMRNRGCEDNDFSLSARQTHAVRACWRRPTQCCEKLSAAQQN